MILILRLKNFILRYNLNEKFNGDEKKRKV